MHKILLLSSSILIALFSFGTGSSKKAPAGTSAVPNLPNQFLDKVEITNIAWREYLYYQKNEYGADHKNYLTALPDTAIWRQSYDVPFFKPGNYDNWPVVGVSYEQAVAYAKWRSMVVSTKEKRKVTYSLPSIKVYKLASANSSSNKIAEGLYSTKIGFRNFLGLCENAAEMTNKEGEAVMGSERENCLDTFEYVVPKPNLGFRCMAVLN